ncbi:exocyst complex component Sec6-domain-containing protein [Calycina marina]|uniref:Exocyst complex component Sec6-domain-containing protein n=1 Tax=Calycina marina TaxID=1763456 RepID=A0A9P7ZAE5_9HELO|nr:exocyst complex component Sec6-domain-containing protein [Calycina marina]
MDTSAVKLAELLRHPDDLDKIPAMKTEYARKKSVVDSQLRSGLKEQLETTQAGMNGILDGQRTVQLIKDEMMKIDKLCAEAHNMIVDFPNINLVTQTQRNFTAVENMRRDIENFDERRRAVEDMLRDDDADIENQVKLLPIHFELTQLRNIRDDAMEQIARADDQSLQATLEDHFKDLDGTIEWFDEHVGAIAMNQISIIQNGSDGLVVRLAVILEAEERSDKKILALQEALKDHERMAARFQSITEGARYVRGYMGKFLDAIQLRAEGLMEQTKEAFLNDPSRLAKELKWFFNDLNTVKVGMVKLVPKKWKVMRTYGRIYHKVMHDFLVGMIDDPETNSTNMLAILNWPEKYYEKMNKLGFKEAELVPQVIDGREPELVREFRQKIIDTADSWIDHVQSTERREFSNRAVEGANLDRNEYGYLQTKNSVDLWRMLQEQIDVAAISQRMDVTEGVVDAMIIRLKTRQTNWQTMLDNEAAKYTGNPIDSDGFGTLQEWLVAVANDQIACIDDLEEEQRWAYLSSFQQKFTPLVSPTYSERAEVEINALRDSYVDFSSHCLVQFVQLVFAVDFKPVMPEFFTAKWYNSVAMSQIAVTFEEYIGEYREVIHHSLMDIFIEALTDELLRAYLGCVRNKGAKFKRIDPFAETIARDIKTLFDFLDTNQYISEPVNDAIREKWRVAEQFLLLIAAEKEQVPVVFADFKSMFWDLQLSWVEAVLRSRDDFDRGMLKAVKTRAAEIEVERGVETLIGKIKLTPLSFAPEQAVLKRQRSRPGEWWAASTSSPGPLTTTSTQIRPAIVKENAPVKRNNKRILAGGAGREESKRGKKRGRFSVSQGGDAQDEQSQQISSATRLGQPSSSSGTGKTDKQQVNSSAMRRGRSSQTVEDISAIYEEAIWGKGKRGRGDNEENDVGPVIAVEMAASSLVGEKEKTKKCGPQPVDRVDEGEESSRCKPSKSKNDGVGAGRDSGQSLGSKDNEKNSCHTSSKVQVKRTLQPEQVAAKSKSKNQKNRTRREIEGAELEDEDAPEEEEPKESPAYQHLVAVTRRVSRQTIEARWEPLPSLGLEYISDLINEVQRPVVIHLNDERRKTQALTAMQMVSRRLVKKLSKLPFPQGKRNHREDDFNYEKILDHNRTLESLLTPTLHANELLEAELQKEKDLLDREKIALDELSANAKTESVLRNAAGRKVHPQLQADTSASFVDEMEDLGLHESTNSAPVALDVLDDENLHGIVKELGDHMESIEANIGQVKGISQAATQCRAAVQATLSNHLEFDHYGDVVWG